MCSITLVCWLAIADPAVPPPPIHCAERSLPQVETGGKTFYYNSLAFSPDNAKLAVMVDEARVGFTRAINSQSARLLSLGNPGAQWIEQSLGKHGSLFHCSFSGVGVRFTTESSRLLALSPVSGANTQEYSILDALSGRPVRAIEHKRTFPALWYGFSVNGKFFACGGWEYSRDREHNGFLQYGGGECCAWELETGRQVVNDTWVDGDACQTISFSADGRTLAVAGGTGKWDADSGEVRLFDLDTGRRMLSLTGHSSAVSAVAFTSDGSMLISGDLVGCEIKYWQMPKGCEVGSLFLKEFPHPWTIRSIALSPDDKLLAVAMANFNRGQKAGKVCVIDVASKATIAVPLENSPDPICCVAFSADGRRLAACGYKTLKLWDVSPDDGRGAK